MNFALTARCDMLRDARHPRRRAAKRLGDKKMLSNRVCAVIAALLLALPLAAQTGAGPAAPAQKSRYKPQKSVKKTLEQAIKALENNECDTFAVDFLNPIERAKIQNLETFRRERACESPTPGSLDEILLTLRLARLGKPEYRGLTATIPLEGIGLRLQKLVLVKYLDHRWYFTGGEAK
jgi:hypothetical protein